jgi:hypothetical protein
MRESTSGVRIASDATPPLSVELAVWAFAGAPMQSRPAERAVIGNKAIRRGKVRSIARFKTIERNGVLPESLQPSIQQHRKN